MASDKGKKDGRFSFEEIHQYLLQGMYPSTFSKSDKQALRKRPNFSPEKALTYSSRVEAEVRIETTFCSLKHVTSDCFSFCAYNK